MSCFDPCTLLEIPGFVDQIAEAVFDKNDCRAEFLVKGSTMLFKPQWGHYQCNGRFQRIEKDRDVYPSTCPS